MPAEESTTTAPSLYEIRDTLRRLRTAMSLPLDAPERAEARAQVERVLERIERDD